MANCRPRLSLLNEKPASELTEEKLWYFHNGSSCDDSDAKALGHRTPDTLYITDIKVFNE